MGLGRKCIGLNDIKSFDTPSVCKMISSIK